MTMQEGTGKNTQGGCCASMMGKFFNQGTTEGKAAFDFKKFEEMMKSFGPVKDGKIDFAACGQMMKNCCPTKDGKFDFAACMSKMQECCKATPQETDKGVTK
jgi:hypothetical protein